MDRLEAMALLSEVVDRGSLSAAGRFLRIPIPTLSRKISDLETRLGARLLLRTTRRVTLTDAGAIYLAAARRILNEVDEAEREAAGEFTDPKGDLVVTAPLQFGRLHILPIVAKFLALFPAITIRLALADRNVHLVDEHVDVALRIGHLDDSAMVATRVGSMRLVTCASPGLLDRHGVPLHPHDLKAYPAVTADAPLPGEGWRFHEAGSPDPIPLTILPRLSVTTTEAAAQAAQEDVGVVQLLHYQVAEAVKVGALRIVLESFEIAPVPIHLIHAARGQLPLKMRRFLDFAVPRLRERVSRVAGIGGEPSPSRTEQLPAAASEGLSQPTNEHGSLL